MFTMKRRQLRLISLLTATLAVYLPTLGAMLAWHWSLPPPHLQPSPMLMIAFGLWSALVGLSSIMVALAALHWTRRVAGLVAGVAVLALFFNPFLDWDPFLIWQVLVMFGVETVGLLFVLLMARSLGWCLAFVDARGQWEERRTAKRLTASTTLRFSISDILILTAAMALLFGVVRGSHPIDLGTVGYAINVAGGCAAALVVLTILWACFGSLPVWLRASTLIAAAPTGGIVYIVLGRYATLLFNWQFYAGVTSLQVLLMTIPCLILRSWGLRFVHDALGATVEGGSEVGLQS
jgi:hypothetical protein